MKNILLDFFEVSIDIQSDQNLIILDLDGNINQDIICMGNYQEQIEIKKNFYQIEFYDDENKFLLFFEKNIRDKTPDNKYIVFYSGHLDFSKGSISIIENYFSKFSFNLQDFLHNMYKIYIPKEDLSGKSVIWFIENKSRFDLYRIEKGTTDATKVYYFNHEEFINFENEINKAYENLDKSLLPLFVVDLTPNEFSCYLYYLNEAYGKYPEDLRERRQYFKELIIKNINNCPINKDNQMREISEHNKEKMAINFMISFNRMGIIEDDSLFNKLFKLKNVAISEYYKILRDFLYTEMNWSLYVNSIRDAKRKGIKNVKKYVSFQLYKKFKDVLPNRYISGWIKQFDFVKKWLYDEDLNFIEHYIDKTELNDMNEKQNKQETENKDKKIINENQKSFSFDFNEETLFGDNEIKKMKKDNTQNLE